MTPDEALAQFDNASDYDSKIDAFIQYFTDSITPRKKVKPRGRMQFKGSGGVVLNDGLHRYHFQRASPNQPVATGGHANPPTRIVRIINCGSEWVG
jgi:hypothetical protein